MSSRAGSAAATGSRWIWRWGWRVLLVLLLLYYPVGAIIIENIDDDAQFAPRSVVPGESRAVAVAADLVTREVDVHSWTPMLPFFTPAGILDNILFPSKQIEAKYLTYVLETKRGQVHSGLLIAKDASKVVLKDATAKLIEVPAGDVENLTPQQKSLMPDLLLRDFTAEQVADLTAFLSSLK